MDGYEEGLHLKVLLLHIPEPFQGFWQGTVLKTTTASLSDLFLPRPIMYKLHKQTRNRIPVPLAERTTLLGHEKVLTFSIATCVLRYLLHCAPVQPLAGALVCTKPFLDVGITLDVGDRSLEKSQQLWVSCSLQHFLLANLIQPYVRYIMYIM